MTQNVCDCPDPPGGQTSCEPHQVAICRVRNGKVYASCVTLTDDLEQAAVQRRELRRIAEYLRGELRDVPVDNIYDALRRADVVRTPAGDIRITLPSTTRR